MLNQGQSAPRRRIRLEQEKQRVASADAQITLHVAGLHLGRQTERIHEELAERDARGRLLVKHVADIAANAVDESHDMSHRALQRVEVGRHLGRALRGILRCSTHSLESGPVCVAVPNLVRHGDEEARVAGALRRHTNRRRDVRAAVDGQAGRRGHGQMNSRMRPGAVALLAVEVLDEGGECVELGAGGVPAHEHLARVCAQL